jgi:hypothetical protein
MKIRIVAAVALLSALPALAQDRTAPSSQQEPRKIDPVKEADIRRMIDAMGGKKLMEDMKSQMYAQVKPLVMKDLPPGERGQKIEDAFAQKFRVRFKTAELLEQVIPIYDKYFTDEDIQGLIQFYQSPLGQRFAKAMPQASAESAALSLAWSQKNFQAIWRELQAEFPELKEPEENAPSNQ